MKTQSLLAAAALLGLLAGPTFAQGKDSTDVTTMTSPGKGMKMRTRTVTATVTEVDAAKRSVTVKGPKGNVFPLKVGPDVRNLEQVKVGDRVMVVYQESLSLTLMKGGKELRGSTETSAAARTPAGDRPGVVAADQVTVTADVVALDAKRQVVTLKGPVETVELWVRDPKQWKLIKVGDQVEAVYTQAVALSVQPAASK